VVGRWRAERQNHVHVLHIAPRQAVHRAPSFRPVLPKSDPVQHCTSAAPLEHTGASDGPHVPCSCDARMDPLVEPRQSYRHDFVNLPSLHLLASESSCQQKRLSHLRRAGWINQGAIAPWMKMILKLTSVLVCPLCWMIAMCRPVAQRGRSTGAYGRWIAVDALQQHIAAIS
jgi:hypothetical protein